MAWKFYNNFTAGEWTPKLDGRSDLQKYDSACRKLQNMRVMPYGGVRYRQGFRHVAATKFPDKPSRLIPFEYSTSVRYMVEMGERHIRIHSLTEDAFEEIYQDEEGNNLVPYSASQVFAIQYKQVNDVMYLVHPDVPVQKLSRTPEGWKIEEVIWNAPAFLNEDTSGTKLTLIRQGDEGDYMLTASSDNFFKLGHLGAYYQLNYPEDAANINLRLYVTTNTTRYQLKLLKTVNGYQYKWIGHGGKVYPVSIHPDGSWFDVSDSIYNTLDSGAVVNGQTIWPNIFNRGADNVDKSYFEMRILTGNTTDGIISDAVEVQGPWTITTSGHWYGTLYVQRSVDGGETWSVARKYYSASDNQAAGDGDEQTTCLLRLRYKSEGDPFNGDIWNGSAPTSYAYPRANLNVEAAFTSTIVRVTEIIDPKTAKVIIIDAGTISNGEAESWSEGAWSDYRGYPRAIGMYQQRLMLGGTLHQPNTFWCSMSDDFENFSYGEASDADGISNTIAATEQNAIQWIDSMRVAIAGTSAREFTISSGEGGEMPLTPSSISVQAQTANGSEHIQGVPVSDAVICVGRQGRRINEIAYALEKDGYALNDLTTFAEHITEGGVRQMAFAEQPDPTLLVVLESGEMAVLTYNRTQDVVAWTKWITQGRFESVASVSGSPSDEIWVTSVREVEGGQMRFVERLMPESEDSASGCWLDSALFYDGGGESISRIEGLPSWLNRRTVDVSIDGRVFDNMTVTLGAVDLEREVPNAKNIMVGFSYRGVLQTMKLDTVLASGPSQGRKRRISELTLRFKDTASCKYGPDEEHLQDVDFHRTESLMGRPPPASSEDTRVYWDDGNTKSGCVCIVQDSPLPFMLLGISVKWEVFGD